MKTHLRAKTIFTFLLLFVMGQAIAQMPTIGPITVAQDGSGNFKTIQEAINSVRDLAQREVKIFIKKGVYNEKLVIPSWKTGITLIGESKENTIITGNDHTGKAFPGGKDPSGKTEYMTFTTYTVLVQGDDFRAENLTIQNTAGRVGQAVALHVEGDRAIIKNCNILGNQDTLYTATGSSRQYYVDCFIEGTTDFIFGEATAVFENCTIKSLSNSYITAAATTANQQFGYVFINCKLITAPEASEVYLGRPWRPYAKTVFISTEMGAHIVPKGWHHWPGDKMFPDKEKTTFYAEFQSSGPGANSGSRVAWSHQLKKKEAKKYTLKNIFAGTSPWDPSAEVK
ncbi:pectinesterase family protein [Pedobacter sp. SYSU D00535]|uniref:pectinesterase family protein n=1 Tax=Pedobacter sp. SYSU D00535 TaxID=2810308 RepID=UPI001A9630E4|nr:pectinesterase family protein [Pedobacter sp. SYSU D00535]